MATGYGFSYHDGKVRIFQNWSKDDKATAIASARNWIEADIARRKEQLRLARKALRELDDLSAGEVER